ncbi:MAG: NAD(P)-dependent oxidoreductase [Burkholderiales bacterium]|nr:NAD(P)-dependent oxidoreductase [Burkholderiales bacterium]
MKIFVAGGSGAIGRFLVPMLVGQGHETVVLTRSADRAAAAQAIGARAVVGDVFDGAALDALVAAARPEIVIHQLTAFGATDADPLAETIRIRTEGTRNLVGAARAAGARRLIAQSISFICTPVATGLTDEQTPLYLDGPGAVGQLAASVAELEQRTLGESAMEGVVLRYGWFYGPGTNYDPAGTIPAAIRKQRMPLVGTGSSTYSFISLQDAAQATVLALARGKPGIYNIVDDEPARQDEWLPHAANLLHAPPPARMDEDLAADKLGEMMFYLLGRQSGASNAKAVRELGWRPATPSWRSGFSRLYANAAS